jgi:4-hydroxybenzoate-CoA ligase
MSVGATTLLLAGRPTPDGVMAILTNEGPTLFCGVPTLFSAMLAACQGDGQVKTALRLCISAGEALPAAVGEGWLALTGVDILDGVGSTEMLHIFLSNREGDVAYGTSGVAVPGYDLRLVDEAGAEVGVGEIGELLVAGDSAADGYWNQREKSRATFEGIWTRTGDKYERAADGRLIYCGRTDDMFKVSGIWVSPFEVEQSIAAHDDVIEAAVVPATDDEGLLKPKAFVVLKADVDAGGIDEAIKAHVKADIGKWKYPRWVEIVEDLPKTATGKIQRFKLREGA